MAVAHTVLCLVALCAVAMAAPSRRKPFAGEGLTYIADVIVSLPYYDISEPVRVYYDDENHRSRSDYYNGQDVYIHRQDMFENGVTFQVVPTTFKNADVVTSCFEINGTKDSPVQLQGVLPIANMDHLGTTNLRGLPVEIWGRNETQGNRTGVYLFYVASANDVPVRYHFVGYDDLYGSHFDEYVIDYLDFRTDVNINPSLFAPPSNLQCGNFPGPGAKARAHTRGALSMFDKVDLQEEALHQDFEDFKTKHGKEYTDKTEHLRRKDIFRQNVRYINSINRQNLSYKLAVNHLADLTPDERSVMRGHRSSPRLPSEMQSEPIRNVPSDFDWRDQGAVSTVKDQGICGSCWSFSSAESLESAYYLATGRQYMIPMSQQALMDCSWGYGNNACDGGEAFRAYEWVKTAGFIPTEATYGVYEMADGACHYNAPNIEKGPRITSYTNLTSGDIGGAKSALVAWGPLAVAIDASRPSFSFYSSGVYYDDKCQNTPDGLDHAVMAVGFGVESDGTEYWLVKNSWSDHWGDDGYIKMSMKNNNCGVATDAHYVRVASAE